MKISTILDHIESGQMTLPEFQRGYVWNRDQVRGLMDSLYKQNPIGTLLVWVTEADAAMQRGDLPSPPGMVKLLLDGQQRMTSIYGIIRGQAPAFFDGNPSMFTGLYFNMETEEFSFYMPTKMDHDPLWINVSKLMIAGHNGYGEIAQKFADSPEGMQSFYSKYTGRLSNLLNICQRDLHIEEITGKEKTLTIVVDIFNKVNSGGTKLSAGDLALAKICASWQEARNEMKKAISTWEDSGYNFDLDWLLRVMNAEITGEANFVHLHNKSVEQIKKGLKSSQKNINYLLNLISGRLGLDHDRVLFGRYAFPVMSRYLSIKGGQLDVTEQNKLLLWYLIGSLWGRYSNSTESIIDKDLSMIEGQEHALDNLIEEVQLWRGGLYVQAEHFKSWGRGSRFYPLLYLLTRIGEARDFGTGLRLKKTLLGSQNSLEVHHIFPKSILYEAGYKKEDVNALANFCFLTKNTNAGLINKRKPEEYFAEVEGKFPGVLQSQWIPLDKNLWKLENYKDFLEERRKLLAKAANEFIDSLRSEDRTEVIVGRQENFTNEKEYTEFANKSPEEIVEMLKAWLKSLGVQAGKDDYELIDTDKEGGAIIIYDLAWPNGLREGLDLPVGLALQASPSSLESAKAKGFESFSQPEKFKQYVTNVFTNVYR